VGLLSEVYCFDVNGALEAHFNTRLPNITSLCLSFGYVWEDANIILVGHASGEISAWSFGEAATVVSISKRENEEMEDEEMDSSDHKENKMNVSKLGVLSGISCNSSAVTALHISKDQGQLYSGHANGDVFRWKGCK